ncbi:hypothetical protein RDI58_031109 [Solanum bulbocastanum]|uniref:Uncharacterized protein n=1 Tax=Solanum bulbocastanum TaxID=147425 RepID=A0AAN8SQR9_SOLBU
MHGLSVLRRWATTKTRRRRLVGRPCAAEGIYLDRPIRVWCGNGSAFGRVASSRAPVTANSRRGTSGARKAMYGQTLSWGRSWAVPVQELQSASNTFAVIKFSPPWVGAQRRGIASALQGRHRRRGTACHAGRRGGCRACIDEAIHVRRMSGIGLARLGWIPASSSDVLTRIAVSVADQAQSRLVGRRYPVLHTQCAGITRVHRSAFRPPALDARGEPRSRSRAPRLPRSVVRGRGPRAAAGILGFGRRSGHGAFTGSYLPSNECSLRTTAALALAPSAPFRARTGL